MVSRVFPKENKPPTHQIPLFIPLLNVCSVKAYSSDWFPHSKLITLHISTLNSILPFISRVIEEIFALANLLRLCPAMGRAYTQLSLPWAHCKAGVTPETSAGHMHSVPEQQASSLQAPANTDCSETRGSTWGWQPLATAPEAPVAPDLTDKCSHPAETWKDSRLAGQGIQKGVLLGCFPAGGAKSGLP